MRVLIYGTLVVLVALLLLDTNIGSSLNEDHLAAVEEAIKHLEARNQPDDAALAAKLASADGFRHSIVFALLVDRSREFEDGFSFYAYTPILSTSRVFIGESFWDVDTIGRSSVLIHEMAHINWHRERTLRGIPRHANEAQAYLTQYLTHRSVGLSPHTNGIVYWDMMIGLDRYSLDDYPQYRMRNDVQLAEKARGTAE